MAAEVEAVKLFLKEEFYLLQKSISKINRNTDETENSITETTDLFRKQNELLKENASKNTIIKIYLQINIMQTILKK